MIDSGADLNYISPQNREPEQMQYKNRKNNAMLAGIGLDNDDGHKRLTKGDNFILVGGSEETHETMKETAIKFNEQLSRRGKHLEELSKDEFIDMMRNASEK